MWCGDARGLFCLGGCVHVLKLLVRFVSNDPVGGAATFVLAWNIFPI